MALVKKQRVSDAISHFCVRYDDTDLAGAFESKEFLAVGIPVVYVINDDRVGDSTRVSQGDINDIAAFAERNGTFIEVASHANYNWDQETNPEDYTWAQWRTELDPSGLISKFGSLFNKCYVHPGNETPWGRAQQQIIRRLLEEYGFEFAIGLTTADATSGGTNAGGPYLNAPNGAPYPTFYDQDEIRPGIIQSPWDFPDNFTLDLGTSCVPRGAYSTAGGAYETHDPRSGAPTWALGNGNSGDAINDAEQTFQWRLQRCIQHGAGRHIALHGEVRSDASTVNFAAGAATSTGHFSARHAAWFCAELRDAGQAKFVGMNDWCRHYYSDWEIGADLVQNPKMWCAGVNLPKVSDYKSDYDNNQSKELDPDIIDMARCGNELNGTNAWALEIGTVGGSLSQEGSLPRIADDAGGSTIQQLFGATAVGTWKTTAGVMRLRPDSDHNIANTFTFAQGQISAGRYQLSIPIVGELSSHALRNNRLAIYGERAYRKSFENLDAFENSEIEKKQRVIAASDTAATISMPGPGIPNRVEFNFTLPSEGLPDIFEEESWDHGAIGADATVSSTFTVTGARIGARVRVYGEDMDSLDNTEVAISGEVTAADTVTLYARDLTGAGISASGSVQYWIAVEDLEYEWQTGQMTYRNPTSPWQYYVGFELRFNDSGEGNVWDPRLERIGDA